MFPSETVILMDIARNKDSGNQLINRPMDVINEYIRYLCDSLVRRGYIKGNRTKGYELTSMGRKSLEFEVRTKLESKKPKKPRQLVSSVVRSWVNCEKRG